MLFNPVIYIVLTGLSLALGTMGLINTDNWLFMLPCLIFAVLFSISLFRPVTTRSGRHFQMVAKPQGQFRKLTADRLRAMSAVARADTAAYPTDTAAYPT